MSPVQPTHTSCSIPHLLKGETSNVAGGAEEAFSEVLLGFHVARAAPHLTLDVLKTHRPPLILDLDETLVISHTLQGLNNRIRDVSLKKQVTNSLTWT